MLSWLIALAWGGGVVAAVLVFTVLPVVLFVPRPTGWDIEE